MTNFPKSLWLLGFLLNIYCVNSQVITSGPVVGAVRQGDAKVYLRTGTVGRAVLVELDTSLAFGSARIFSDSTRSNSWGAGIIRLDSLKPNTRYYGRFRFGATTDLRTFSFRTFPDSSSKEPLKIVVGSCNYVPNTPLFRQIKNLDPHLFIHLGDWNWPPATYGIDYNKFPDRIAESFASRYSDSSMRTFIQPFMPVDYVYDDDYTINDNEGWTYPEISVNFAPSGGTATTQLRTVKLDSAIRQGAIRGYFQHFPAYEPVDTSQGIYHSIRIGNVEILMLDLRTSRSPRHEVFVYDSSARYWNYQADSVKHSMMGSAQRNWMMQRLQNSTADWKVIGSSVVFNKNYRRVFDFAMQAQNVAINFGGRRESGLSLASNFAYNWILHPADQVPILRGVNNGTLKDLVVVSGDSHSNALDDGTNSGVPEMNASGLAANNEGYLNRVIDSVSGIFSLPAVKDSLWNSGGNGVGNTNYNDGYGLIEVYGNDSMKLCVIDEWGNVLGCMTLIHSSKKPVGIRSLDAEKLQLQIFPNPSTAEAGWRVYSEHRFEESVKIRVLDMAGKWVAEYDYAPGALDFLVSAQGLAAGVYVLEVSCGRFREELKLVLH